MKVLSFDVSISHILYYLWDISLAGIGHLLSDRSPIFGTNVPRDLVWHYWWLSVNWDCFIGEDISLTNVIGGPNLKHWYFVNVITLEVVPFRKILKMLILQEAGLLFYIWSSWKAGGARRGPPPVRRHYLLSRRPFQTTQCWGVGGTRWD